MELVWVGVESFGKLCAISDRVAARKDCRKSILGFENWLLGLTKLPERDRSSSKKDQLEVLFAAEESISTSSSYSPLPREQPSPFNISRNRERFMVA